MGKFKSALKITLKFIDDNLPLILTIAAEVGLVTTTISAIHDAPIAKEAIISKKLDKAEEIEIKNPEALVQYKNDDGSYDLDLIKLNVWEYAQVLTPIYWKTGVSYILTGTCIFMANHVGHKRYLALLGALALKEKDLEKYQEKLKEFLGEKKTKEFEQEMNKDIAANWPEDEDEIYYTGHGDYMCYEPLSHSYFRSSIDAVKSGINDFVHQLITEGTATVSDLAYNLDINLRDPYLEDRSGWTYNNLRSEIPEFTFDYTGHPVTNEPMLVIKCNNNPVCGLY